jgi:hypothetical protein
MNEAFNFHDTLVIAQYNWWLILLALALGIWFGWSTSIYEPDDKRS